MRSLLINSFFLLFPFAMQNKLQLTGPVKDVEQVKNMMPGQGPGNQITNGYALQSVKNKMHRKDSTLV